VNIPAHNAEFTCQHCLLFRTHPFPTQEFPMPVAVEAIQGYLMRAGLKFTANDQGNNGQFVLSFKTRHYENPAGDKSLMLIVNIAEAGRYLEITAVGMYSAKDAKDIGKLAQFLLGQNYVTKILRWELDRTDGEVRASVEVAPVDGSVTFNSFMRMLMLFPMVAESLHPTITKVMKTGQLPAPVRVNKRLQELVRRAGGIASLERLVRSHEKATRDSVSLDPEVAKKFGLEITPEPPGLRQDVANVASPPPACRPEDISVEPAGDTPQNDVESLDDDGPCSCDSPVDE